MTSDYIIETMTLGNIVAFDTIVACDFFRIKVIQVHISFQPWLSTKQPADVIARDVT
jgi:hypothetical protein